MPDLYSDGSKTLLNGPFLGRFAIRSNLSFSAGVSLDFRFSPVILDATAGTAERCDSIFREVSWMLARRGSVLRTVYPLLSRQQQKEEQAYFGHPPRRRFEKDLYPESFVVLS